MRRDHRSTRMPILWRGGWTALRAERASCCSAPDQTESTPKSHQQGGNPLWPRSCASCTTTPSTDIRPHMHARGSPTSKQYPDGQTLPTPSEIDFTPGQLLGSVSGGLGLRKYLEGLGHEFVVTSDKEGSDSEFERNLPDAEVVISQPFWPAYMTAERFDKAKNLKLVITAGIGSDHTDLDAAIEHGVTVAEVTYCNSISVAEHVVMMILSLVRNYLPSNQWVRDGGWNIADCVARSYDLEGMEVGTVAAGRIGLAVLRRLAPFDVRLQLHRPPSVAWKRRERAGPDVLRDHPGDGPQPRRGDDQRAATSGDAGPLRRRVVVDDAPRRVSHQHRAWAYLRPRRDRPCAGERSTRRLCRGCVVSATCAQATTRGERCPTTG